MKRFVTSFLTIGAITLVSYIVLASDWNVVM